MDHNFWLDKWERNDIAFHEKNTNPALLNYWSTLSVDKGGRVFVPLCGKTLDIAWLLAQGFEVAGAELSAKAIDELFANLGVEPKKSPSGSHVHYSAPKIDIFVGSIFDVTKKILGPVDAIYDRAALVALPPDMRRRYAAHLTEITNKAPQLLVSFEYDQNRMEGPPFSVSQNEVRGHYQGRYQLTLLDCHDISGGLKGQTPANEHIWHLK